MWLTSTSDMKLKIGLATEVRDNIETWCASGSYTIFLARLVPVFFQILDGQPAFITTSPEQKLRLTVLEIIHRLPMNTPETLEPYAVPIVDKMMALIRVENEENAIFCIKIVMDFQRHHVKALSGSVQPFLDLIQEMFRGMEQVVRDTFNVSAQGIAMVPPVGATGPQFAHSPRPNSPVASSVSDVSVEKTETRPLLKGMQSFKVLSECPIVVVSIFQAHRDVVAANVKKFVPLIRDILQLQATPQEKAHADAISRGTIQIGIHKDVKNRAAFGEFVTAQVKTMSFLAYLLRTWAQQFGDWLPALPAIIVRILRDCPKDKCGTRKELLVAVRHIVNFNFRKIFLKSIDDLLDERTLLGDGLTSYETLRPLAYSFLADLIHHVRDSLTPDQIRLTVKVYTRHLRDPLPGTSFQNMSAKLLMNMSECIAKLEDKQEARYYLIAILDAIGDKFAAINHQYDNAVKISSQFDEHVADVSPKDYLPSKDQPPDWDEIDIFATSPIKVANPRDRVSDPVNDNKFLFKNLVMGLKAVLYQLRICNPQLPIDPANAPSNWTEVACGFTSEEVEILVKLFHEGMIVFQYFPSEKSSNDPQNLAESLANHQQVGSKEEKELLETFATVFHHIDPATFHEVFHSQIPCLYEQMFKHPALIQIPQFLLASEATSPAFAGMLLQFLMDRIEEVGSGDVVRATLLLRLFKLSFMAVTLFTQHNEQVLLPHVNKLVTQSIKLSTTAEAPMHYFYLLRSLFRSIGGGRFEHLYKEILPLLEMLLEVLNSLILAARRTQERDLYVELSLTVPARLSNLLPHLSYLMKPLVLALRAGSELVGQGLRTLELCVDNLTADYLDPIMSPVIDELMTALWAHLRPSPYSHFHAHTTMRILGKLGGRNRKFLDGPAVLEYQHYSDDPCKVDIRLIGALKDSGLPATLGLDQAMTLIQDYPPTSATGSNDGFYKQQALRLVIAQTRLFIGVDSLPADFTQLVRLQANDLSDEVFDKINQVLPDEREKSIAKKDRQQNTLKELLKCCMVATAVPALREEARAFLNDLYTHFVILEIGQALATATQERMPFDVEAGEGLLVIDHRVLADAIVECLSSDDSEVRDTAEHAMLATYRVAGVIFGSPSKVNRLPFFTHLLMISCHSCYEETWFTKAGGILGISILSTKVDLGTTWLIEKQLELVRALVFAGKDLPEELPVTTRVQALDTMCNIIRLCNTETKREDVADHTHRAYGLCGLLVYELSNTGPHVREAAQKGFVILSEMTGMEVHELVAPVKIRLLTHVFSKPLRALSFNIQIGYIEAIAYCMKLQNSILDGDSRDQLGRFLREAIHLADQDDESYTTKAADQRQLESMVRLRVACLHLLSLSLNFPELTEDPSNRGKPRIISVFFKSLYNKSSDVVDAANEALKSVVERDPKLPKDILQTGLRPILVSLQDPAKLKVDGLQCLARLLQLLKNYFKVEIGARLLDNVQHIADAMVLQKASFTLIEQHDKISTVAGVLNIFHLLPPGAATFLEKLVSKTLELEEQLRRTQFSPLRDPIAKYLNRYAQEAWERLFSKQLRSQAHGRFFAQILSEKASEPLREVVSREVETLTAALTSEETDVERWTVVVNVISIVDAICQYPEAGKGLLANEPLRRALLDSGKLLEAQLRLDAIGPNLRLAAELSGRRLMRVLTGYLSSNLEDINCLFEVIGAVTSKQLRSEPDLVKFIHQAILGSTNVEYWRALMVRSIETYTSKEAPEALKAYLVHYLVNPILATDVMRNWDLLFTNAKGTQLVNKALAELMQNKLWRPQATIDTTDENTPPEIDHSRIELLQLTAMLLKYYNVIMQESKREIIRFGWAYIRLEDVINKHAAYVVLTYFAHFFDTPAKIYSQVFVSLLKAHVPEARPLVIQGLEVLAPMTPKRMSVDSNPPIWCKLARKTVLEDPANHSQMLNVFHFIARHPGLFYDAKEQLSQLVVGNIHKVAQLPTPSLENKKLALGLLTLVWTWEQRYATETARLGSPSASVSPQSRKRTADGTLVTTDPVKQQNEKPSNSGSFLSITTRMAVLKYLVQFVAALPDRYPLPSGKNRDLTHTNSAQAAQSTDVCRRAVILFHNFIQSGYWADLDIDAMFPRVVEAILMMEPKADEKVDLNFTRIINTLQLVRVMLNVKSNEWIIARMPQLLRTLEKPVRNAYPEIQDCLYGVEDLGVGASNHKPIITRILEAIPKEVPDDDADEKETPGFEFIAFLSTVATEALGANNHVVGINVLQAFSEFKPEEIDPHIVLVMKSLTQLVKDHINPQPIPQAQSAGGSIIRPDGQPVDPRMAEMQVDLILKSIDLLAVRMSQLGESRRPYLSALTSLVEKSPSIVVGSKILELVETWIFNTDQLFPTLKEKTAVILKMCAFEHRTDPSLFNRFLELVIRVYEDTRVTRSELAIRLEHAFLIGTRAPSIELRNRFIKLFDRHLTRTASKRMLYLLASQSWDVLQDSFWISQIIELLFGSIEPGAVARLSGQDFKVLQASELFGTYSQDARINDVIVEDEYEALMANHKQFCLQLNDVRIRHVLEPLCHLQNLDSELACKVWIALFPLIWSILARDERAELQTGLIALATKEFHHRQIDKRPNCIQALIEGIARADNPRINFPHHLMKFLAKTYNVWYTAANFMERSAVEPIIDTATVRESNLDALAEIYAGLQEDDLFYGLWRRRCQFLDTNTALSYEQHGDWDKAQRMYEQATFKARTGASPFSQGEYMLWEDHWVLCAQKLQQWDVLVDFAKNDNINDLFLDSIWRNLDFWNTAEHRKQLDAVIKGVTDAPTPRRAFFQSFMSLLKLHHNSDGETTQNFSRICDESIQLSIRKWHQLPKRFTNAHVPVLQNFQQLVEMHDASVICASLAQTNQANLDHKSPELKLLLGTWRDRLPNFWDDINAWQDLVTWRSHIFQLVNQKYLSLVPQQPGNNTGHSFAFRGYHETAWTINKFAHIARKHNLPEVCIAQLSRIYTLPNIEIQEAFLKLREQAKCHYQNPLEIQTGLDVIMNTNLNYFGQQQKAEFFTLKGMFLAKQKHTDEANEAFGSALYYDLKLPKAWAEWGRYNDELFKEDPNDISKASNAISCYLEAAGVYKSAKSRKLLSRVLWLLSLDNAEGTLARTFEEFKGETPVWYWTTFIPQLLVSLSRQEAAVSRSILIKIAKQYPQALYFSLRVSREDMQAIRKQQESKEKAAVRTKPPAATPDKPTEGGESKLIADGTPSQAIPPTAEPSKLAGAVTAGSADSVDPAASAAAAPEAPKQEPSGPIPQVDGATASAPTESQAPVQPPVAKKPWEYVEEIVSQLKTAFPLLALSMETMVDQISRNFKCPPDEDAYRLIVALLNDALGYVCRTPSWYGPDVKLPPTTETNITRFAESILPPHIRKSFEMDFVTEKPFLSDYIHKLRRWRDRFEAKLDRRSLHGNLESYGQHLVEFKFQKFDEVEVPGQYLLHKDKNQDFIRIERFLPEVDLTRGIGVCYRRLKLRGHDGSVHAFAVQHPAARTCRREERMLQMFRFFNDVLMKRKESRRRKITFVLPVMIPLTPAIRMVQDDESYITLQGIYEDFCRRKRLSKDEPILMTVARLRELNPVSLHLVHCKARRAANHVKCRRRQIKRTWSARRYSKRSRPRVSCRRHWCLTMFHRSTPRTRTSGCSADSLRTSLRR